MAPMHAATIMAVFLKDPLKRPLALWWLKHTLSEILHRDLLLKTRLRVEIGRLSMHDSFTRLL
jgi:hypothetical protein